MTGNELSLLPPANEWATMLQMATVLVKSQLLPFTIKTPEQAVTIMLKGRELGIPPMQAFASINVIKGKPSLSAELMVAMVRDKGHSVKPVVSTDKVCTLRGKRKDTGDEFESTFTVEMAKQAGLTGPDSMYSKYPTNMLYARAATNLCRVLFSDVIMGLPSSEEVTEYDEPVKQQEVVNRDYNPVPPKLVQWDNSKKEYIKVDTGEAVNVNTGEVIDTPPVEDKPKRVKALNDEEVFERGKLSKYIWEHTGVDTISKGNTWFNQISMDDFNKAVREITGMSISSDALKKYGVEGTLNELVSVRYKGEGLNMGQKLSAALHILWEKEREYETRKEVEGPTLSDVEEVQVSNDFGF